MHISTHYDYKNWEVNGSVKILGVSVHPISKILLHHQIAEIIHSNRRALVLNVNIHALNLAYSNPWLRRFFNQSEIIFADGAGVILAARLIGHKIPERITYADWMWELASFAEEYSYSMYFLGAKPTIADKAARRLRGKFPKLNILGVNHGYFNKDVNSIENEDVVKKINKLSPNILVLGMGMPIQEHWLRENWDRLNVNIALTGGAAFDYVAGELVRAPRWMTKFGFEWFGRLIIEPHRLWKRYVIGNPLFFWRVFIHHTLRIPLPE